MGEHYAIVLMGNFFKIHMHQFSENVNGVLLDDCNMCAWVAFSMGLSG